MSRFRAALGAAVLILAMLSATAAQVRDVRPAAAASAGTVAGQVEVQSDRQRAPVRRAKVTLSREAGGQRRVTATDADGRYRFEGVAGGDYRLHAEKPGFVFAPVEIRVTGGVTVNLDMRRGGALEGRFVDHHGDPIARLVVTADRLPDSAEGAAASDTRSALTDDLGRFRIHTLPPGRYRLHATPPLPASGDRLFYPGTANPAEASVLTVVGGQTLGQLDLTVPAAQLSPIAAEALRALERETSIAPAGTGPSARISGRITRTDTGQPIENATAQIVSGAGAVRRIRSLVRTSVDGRFEFSHLAGGEYVLTASATGYVPADASLLNPGGGGRRIAVEDAERIDRADVLLVPASAIEGHVLDEFGDPAPGVVLQVTRQIDAAGIARFLPGAGGGFATTGPTDDRGWFRASGLFPGDYYLLAVPEPFDRSGPAGFAITFFPGTASVDAASAVHIVAGRDAYDVRFSLVAARTATVSGVATDPAGRPAPKTQVLLLPTHNGEVRAMIRARTTAATDGSFRYDDVPEGTYVVQGAAARLFGSSPVTVSAASNREPRSVALALRPLTTAQGRVVFEGDAAPPRGSVTIGFQPTDFTSGPVGSNRIASLMAADWSFAIPNLAWHGILRLTAPPGWTLARVMLQGRDITDTPYDFQTADVNGLEVFVTSRVGSVSGTVVGGGKPIPEATVFVFGADDTAWTYFSRTLRATRTKDDASFTLGGLLPGRYLAVATSTRNTPVDQNSIVALRSLATAIVVVEGANPALTLTTVR